MRRFSCISFRPPGIRKSRRLIRFAQIAGLLVFFDHVSPATSHVFARTQDGVWLASDTLVMSNGTPVHTCKVAISERRLFFLAGAFSDPASLETKEAALPLEDVDDTETKTQRLLLEQLKHLKPTPHLQAHTGIIQILPAGDFQARLFGEFLQPDGTYLEDGKYVRKFTVGIVHGYGTEVDQANFQTFNDARLAARVTANPKGELIRILRKESALRPSEVQGPYTLFLLRNDGTILNFSDTRICGKPRRIGEHK